MKVRRRTMKTCTHCRVAKPLSAFTARSNTRDGLQSWCKPCCAEAANARRAAAPPEKRSAESRAYYEANREKLLAKTIAYREANPEKVRESQRLSKRKNWHKTICNALRGRAVARGLPFEITPETLLDLFEKQGGRCYWLDLPLVITSTDKRDPLQPSLDRLDPDRGYVLGNVVLTCMFANLGRSTLSAQKMRDFVVTLRAKFAE